MFKQELKTNDHKLHVNQNNKRYVGLMLQLEHGETHKDVTANYDHATGDKYQHHQISDAGYSCPNPSVSSIANVSFSTSCS